MAHVVAEVFKANFETVALKKGKKAASDKFIDAATATISGVVISFLAPAAEEMASLIKDIVEVTAAMKSLREENLHLKVELAKLKLQSAGARATAKEPQPTPTPPATENELVALMRQEIAALQQRFNVLEGIVPRPSLAATQKPAAS